jgi:oxygen-independent coproporphyrinogen-3 oxidase
VRDADEGYRGLEDERPLLEDEAPGDACDVHQHPPPFGSYFVSTYPPFSAWTPAELPSFEAALNRTPDGVDADPLGLYIHLPFCQQRCLYCHYLSYAGRTDRIDSYLDAVVKELELYSEMAALSGRPVGFVYFGGGTPSVLETAQIRSLLTRLQAVLPWDRAREVSFECAPRSVTAEKMRALAELGVTRVSLGVQQMDDVVLRKNGRIHLVADVESAWEILDKLDFPVVNVDLMVGLLGETEDSWGSTVERVLELQPESVTIYQLEIPQNTPLYKLLNRNTARQPPPWKLRRRRLAWAFSQLENAGYRVRSAYTAVLDPRRHRFVYQDDQYHGAQLLGLGASSFSYLEGRHQQNLASLDRYLECLQQDRLPLGRAYTLSREEKLVREFVLQLKLGGCGVDDFRSRFGIDLAERFATPLERFVSCGWVEVDDAEVELTRAGLLHVDEMIPAFYLPEHQGIRYS